MVSCYSLGSKIGKGTQRPLKINPIHMIFSGPQGPPKCIQSCTLGCILLICVKHQQLNSTLYCKSIDIDKYYSDPLCSRVQSMTNRKLTGSAVTTWVASKQSIGKRGLARACGADNHDLRAWKF